MNTALMKIPRCDVHNIPMELVIPRTYEQRYVGTMYRCPRCENSVLFPSKELQEQLKRQREAIERRDKQKGESAL